MSGTSRFEDNRRNRQIGRRNILIDVDRQIVHLITSVHVLVIGIIVDSNQVFKIITPILVNWYNK